MELFSPGFVPALLAIIAIDLVLAGDNAIVIALVARRLPAHLQRLTIIAGTAGAVVVRALMTLAIVWLLNIPWLQLAGGLLLIWIAFKLLAPDGQQSHAPVLNAGQTSLAGAIRTIVVADAIMGLDNVLGVAGAAHGNMLLVIIGLLVSVPIMVFGSTLILRWVERFPAIIYIGAGILAWTAAKMIVSEPMLKEFFIGREWLALLIYVAIIGGVLGSGMLRARRGSEEIAHSDYPLALSPLPSPVAAAMPTSTPTPVAPAMPDSMPAAAPTPAASYQTGEEEDAMLRVLVPVDGSAPALDALRQVLREARRVGDARFILLVNVQPLLPRHAARFLSASTRRSWRDERSKKAMASAAGLLREAGLAWFPVTAAGDPASAIARCAQEHGMHKVVMGTSRKGALTRFFQDSVTSRVMELSPVPVEVVAREEASLIERFGIPASLGAGLALLLLAEE